MDTEVWRAVPGLPGYDISDGGRVRSWKAHNGQPLPHLLTVGVSRYPRVTLRLAGRTITRRVHVLLLQAFVGPRPPGMESRHLDGDATRSVLSNLAYGTSAENTADLIRLGRAGQMAKTHCKRGHPFDEANTVRRSGERHCRLCEREGQRRRYRSRHATKASMNDGA